MALSVKNMLGGSGGGASPFAWGKYDKRSEVVNISFSISLDSATTYPILLATSSKDLTQVDASYWVGMETNIIRSNGQIFPIKVISPTRCLSNDYECNFSYNAETCTLTIGVGYSSSYTYTADPVTIDETDCEFIEYVTDKNPLKYPNGEVADDGFFYRYAFEGLYTWEKYFVNEVFKRKWNRLAIPSEYGSYYPDGVIMYKGELHILGSQNSSNTVRHYKLVDNEWVSIGKPSGRGSYVCDGDYIYFCNMTGHFYRYDGISWVEIGSSPQKASSDSTRCSMVMYNNEIHALYQTNHYKWTGTEWELSVAQGSTSSISYGYQACSFNGYIYLITPSYTQAYRWAEGESSWTRVSTTVPYSGNYCALFPYGDVVYGAFANATYNLYYTTDFVTWTPVTTDMYDGNSPAYGMAYDGEYFYVNVDNGARSIQRLGIYELEYEYLDNIVSDNENAYPTDGEQGNYYYKKVSGKVSYGTFVPTLANQYSIDIDVGFENVKTLAVFVDDSSYAGSSYAYFHIYDERITRATNNTTGWSASTSYPLTTTFNGTVATISNTYRAFAQSGTYFWVATG